jgi:hypothetical protein
MSITVVGAIGSMSLVSLSQPVAAASACPASATRVIDVSTADALKTALATAVPGDQIRLADGTYVGDFAATVPGTATAPVTICGSAAAVLDGGTTALGYTLYVANAPYTSIYGVTITDGQKGIVLDNSSHAVIDGVTVHGIGDEGVHFRRGTSDSVIQNSSIYDTGRLAAQYGEGVYVGSAKSNWCSMTSCNPDRSDRDVVLNNRIGPGVTAEEVDIKEGTTGGTVKGNTFDGSSMVAITGGARSWVDVKGNNWLIQWNVGHTTLRSGITDSLAATGWGNNNWISLNTEYVNASGYGVEVAAGVTGVHVLTSNVVYGAALGISNVTLTKG